MTRQPRVISQQCIFIPKMHREVFLSTCPSQVEHPRECPSFDHNSNGEARKCAIGLTKVRIVYSDSFSLWIYSFKRQLTDGKLFEKANTCVLSVLVDQSNCQEVFYAWKKVTNDYSIPSVMTDGNHIIHITFDTTKADWDHFKW